MATINVFGQDVELETIRIVATAINEGFTVTATAVLDNDDTLYSYTVYREKATTDEALEEMAPEAAQVVYGWIEDN